MSQLADDLAALKGEPVTGYCINHAMAVVEWETCPERADEICHSGCMDWRASKPESEPVKGWCAVSEQGTQEWDPCWLFPDCSIPCKSTCARWRTEEGAAM